MLLYLQIKAGAKRDAIIKMDDGTWKIYIRAQPVDGKANKYLVEYLSKVLRIAKTSITIKKGELTSYKTLLIEADEDDVLQLLNQHV